MPIERRKLKFATLDEAVADAESLLTKDYDRAGNWDLAQVAGHLADWMRFPLDGFPKVPLFIRPILWTVRTISGKQMLKTILEHGFTPGTRTVGETVPQPGGDPAAAVAILKETAGRWKTHPGNVHPSPLFGAMTRDTALQLQLVHCSHHLSFLIPKNV
jgi:Protein of unknown function (DUF1569)